MAGENDRTSYFAAAGGPTGLTAGIAELEALRQGLSAPKNNVITPTTGAGAYWHVDPNAPNQQFNPMQERPIPTEGIGLLPENSPNILMQNDLGNAPRIASGYNSQPNSSFAASNPTSMAGPSPLIANFEALFADLHKKIAEQRKKGGGSSSTTSSRPPPGFNPEAGYA